MKLGTSLFFSVERSLQFVVQSVSWDPPHYELNISENKCLRTDFRLFSSIRKQVRATFVSQHHSVCVIMPTKLYRNAQTGVSFTGFWWCPQYQVALMKKVPVVSVVRMPSKYAESNNFLHHQPLTPHVLVQCQPGEFLLAGAGVEIRDVPCRNIKRILRWCQKRSATA